MKQPSERSCSTQATITILRFSQGSPDQVYQEGVFKHVALRVDDCQAAIDLARKAGAEVTVETRDATLKSEKPIQIRIAFFKGPDGELIELFENKDT